LFRAADEAGYLLAFGRTKI